MKTKIKSMKQELKERAQEIRSLKSQRKTHVCKWMKRVTGYVPGLYEAQYTYRIDHIAYSLLRGRKPTEIENKWRDPEDPTHKAVWDAAEKKVKAIYEQFEIHADKELVGYETIRASSE